MRKTLASLILVVMVAMLMPVSAMAAITPYTGLDAGVGPGGAMPNSNAAAAGFDAAAAALGTLSYEDFESAPIGNFGTLNLTNMTVTLTGTASDADAGITNVTGNEIEGYNTTSGGVKHLRFVPPFAVGSCSVTFSFVVPVQAWGAYFTGVGTVPNTSIAVKFNDGTAQSYGVPGAVNGGVSFFGFTDPGKSIVSVTIQEDLTSSSVRDIIGIDDIRIVPMNLDIDIKPWSDPNAVNRTKRGVIPVAILGSADFDPTALDPTELSFNFCGVSVMPSHDITDPDVWNDHIVNVWFDPGPDGIPGTTDDVGDVTANMDLYPDVVIHFNVEDIAAAILGEKGDDFTGVLIVDVGGSYTITGSDVIRIAK